MAYAQWVVIILKNDSGSHGSMKIKNLNLAWGKLHADGDKDTEVPISDYEGKVIKPGESIQINSCGRSDASSGTEGSFNLVEPDRGDYQIRHIYWECPWGDPDNQFTINGSDTNWLVDQKGANPSNGALGNVTVTAYKKDE
ncbi:hypothetical protein VNI00_003037 [Paramarasmius palmivorus]|uniref:Uncharacterized protein n=1 Tax=Paramarasmius palmivorus TaxID=297713 RepID=A0AAW0DXQ3_9AGAR